MANTTESSPDTSGRSDAKLKFEIPRFSTTASQLIDKLNEEDPDVTAIIRLIECDPTVSSKILGLANSPVFGSSRVISTIGQAIVVLGFRCVAQQAIAAVAGDLFKEGDPASGEHRRNTYIQSLGIATVGRRLASETRATDPDQAFLVGVLHDIGKLVLLQHLGATYTELLGRYPNEASLGPETEAFGICHTTLGRQCGVAWSLPHDMCIAIENHHLTLAEISDPLTLNLVCASYLGRKWLLGFDETDFLEDLDLEVHLEEFQRGDAEENCRQEFEVIREICS